MATQHREESAMRKIIPILLLLAPALQKTLPAQAQVENKQIRDALIECLVAEVAKGGYSSSDGGRSEIRLIIKACKAQSFTFENQCIAEGGAPSGENGCDLWTGIFIQGSLKILGK
jgi:hypothetical protein